MKTPASAIGAAGVIPSGKPLTITMHASMEDVENVRLGTLYFQIVRRFSIRDGVAELILTVQIWGLSDPPIFKNDVYRSLLLATQYSFNEYNGPGLHARIDPVNDGGYQGVLIIETGPGWASRSGDTYTISALVMKELRAPEIDCLPQYCPEYYYAY